MAVFQTVKVKELSNEIRFDAEYYRPEYLALEKIITSRKYIDFGNIISFFGSGNNIPQVESALPPK